MRIEEISTDRLRQMLIEHEQAGPRCATAAAAFRRELDRRAGRAPSSKRPGVKANRKGARHAR